MNNFEKMCLIVKMNEDSQLTYDKDDDEYVITFVGGGNRTIPSDCEFKGYHIVIKGEGRRLCRVWLG